MEESKQAEPCIPPALVAEMMHNIALRIECPKAEVQKGEATWVAANLSELVKPLKGWKLAVALLLLWAVFKAIGCWRAVALTIKGKKRSEVKHADH